MMNIVQYLRYELRFSFLAFCVQKSDGTCNTNFKRTKHKEEVMQALDHFVDSNASLLVREDRSCVLCRIISLCFAVFDVMPVSRSQINYQQRLKELRLELEKSDFFKTHEVKKKK